MSDSDTKRESKAAQLIKFGTELAGSAASSVLSLAAADPASATAVGVGSVIISKAFTQVGDVAARQLSHREQVRTGAAAAIAVNGIWEHLLNNETPRDDDFFEPREGGDRSPAEEILEGVLLKSKNEFEEKKVRFLGNFYANLAFSPGVSVGEAIHLLSIAESFTYRQICILAFVQRLEASDAIRNSLRPVDYRKTKLLKIHADLLCLLQEVYELDRMSIVRCINEAKSGFDFLMGWTDVTPANLMLHPLGERLATLLDVNQVDQADVDSVWKLLVNDLVAKPDADNKPA
jgi:hypothetical protein